MADIVLAIATSHSPLLNSPAEDYPKHAAIDASGRKLLDKQGRPCTYGELLAEGRPFHQGSDRAASAGTAVRAMHREYREIIARASPTPGSMR